MVADVESIDAQIGVIWPKTPTKPGSVLFLSKDEADIQHYAAYLTRICKLLNAQYTCLTLDARHADRQMQGIYREQPCDLLIYAGEAPGKGRKRGIIEERKLLHQAPASVMLLQGVRWPVQHVLLCVQSLDLDESALAWTVFLARALGASVAVVPLLPLLPAIYAQDPHLGYNIPSLLKSDCRLGKRLRAVCRTLDAYSLSGTLVLESAALARQWPYRQADLVLLAGRIKAGAQRIYYRDIVQKFLQVAGTNLLLAKGCPFSDVLLAGCDREVA